MKYIMIKLILKIIYFIIIMVCWWFFVFCMVNSNWYFVWMKLMLLNFIMCSVLLDDKILIVFK